MIITKTQRCGKCQVIKPRAEFHASKTRAQGIHCYCKVCNNAVNLAWQNKNIVQIKVRNSIWAKNNSEKLNAKSAKKRAIKLQATPPWFEAEKVALVYQKAKEWGFEVDHVIPLKGKSVSGLHCWANLQLLDKTLNRSKGNKV